jgi:hypothetical protein
VIIFSQQSGSPEVELRSEYGQEIKFPIIAHKKGSPHKNIKKKKPFDASYKTIELRKSNSIMNLKQTDTSASLGIFNFIKLLAVQTDQNGQIGSQTHRKKPDKERLNQLAKPRNYYNPAEKVLKTQYDISFPQTKRSMINISRNAESLEKLKYK